MVTVSDPDGLADISQVRILVWDPALQYQGSVLCPRIDVGVYGYTSGGLMPVPPGAWTLGAKVIDKSGAVGSQLLTLTIQ